MKKDYFIKRFFILIYVLFFTSTYAKEKIFIAYGETIKNKLHIPTNQLISTRWEISNNDEVYSGIGESIYDQEFKYPSIYHLKIIPNPIKFPHEHYDSCSLLHNPIEYEVIVSSVRMKFIFDELTFSKPLTGGKPLIDIAIQVPVIVETYNNKPFIYKDGNVNTAGVGTSIKGEIVDKKCKLKIGKNLLTYKLSGIAISGTYIMFDFNAADGSIQSYSLTTPIL